MRRLFILVSILALISSACRKDKTPESCDLASTGLLGEWEIQKRVVNGFHDLSVQCCEFITFSEDAQENDCRGTFEVLFGFDLVNGTFEVIPEDSLLHFTYNMTENTFTYSVETQASPHVLFFHYTNFGDDIEEWWHRMD